MREPRRYSMSHMGNAPTGLRAALVRIAGLSNAMLASRDAHNLRSHKAGADPAGSKFGRAPYPP